MIRWSLCCLAQDKDALVRIDAYEALQMFFIITILIIIIMDEYTAVSIWLMAVLAMDIYSSGIDCFFEK